MDKEKIENKSDFESSFKSPSSNKKPETQKNTTRLNMPPRQTWIWFIVILIINFLIMKLMIPSPDEPITIPYTLFKEEVGKKNVQSIYTRADSITGRFRVPITYAKNREISDINQVDSQLITLNNYRNENDLIVKITFFKTTIPAFVDSSLESFLIDNGVEISALPLQEQRSLLMTILYSFGPGLLLIFFYIILFRKLFQQRGGGALGIGKSKARRYDQEKDVKVTFDDVAGIDEAENELIEIVDFLKNPEKYTRLGGTVPKGVLLIGAPGTGKTLLAKAVAGEAGVPFYSMSAAEFVEMIVGVGASRVRDLFRQARENAPAIIFIDELDAIGRARGQISIGGASEQEQTLNQILTEMDGFSGREGIIVLAATNQPEVLDKALLRPGRFDRRVIVNLPDKVGREAILKVHTRTVPLADDANLGQIAAITPGFSGADLKNLVNEAAILAARRGQEKVSYKDFIDALEKIVLGPERPLLLSSSDKERIAYHESGHTILGLVIPGADPVSRVTIVPRGQALGVTYQRPDSDLYNLTEDYLRARIIGILGGRAAEEIVYGIKTTGAQSDIEQATYLARQMVTVWGMSDKLGAIQLAPRENPYLPSGTFGFGEVKPFSEETAKTIDAEILRIINESHAEAKRLLTLHRAQLDVLAKALIEKETLDEKEIFKVTGLQRLPASQPENFPV